MRGLTKDILLRHDRVERVRCANEQLLYGLEKWGYYDFVSKVEHGYASVIWKPLNWKLVAKEYRRKDKTYYWFWITKLEEGILLKVRTWADYFDSPINHLLLLDQPILDRLSRFFKASTIEKLKQAKNTLV